METAATLLIITLGSISAAALSMWLVARFGFVMRLWALYWTLVVLAMFLAMILVSTEDLDPRWLGVALFIALATFVLWLPAWPAVRVVLERLGVRARW